MERHEIEARLFASRDGVEPFEQRQERWRSWRLDYLTSIARVLQRRLDMATTEAQEVEREQLRLGLQALRRMEPR